MTIRVFRFLFAITVVCLAACSLNHKASPTTTQEGKIASDASDESLPIYSGAVMPPYNLFVGDADDWHRLMQTTPSMNVKNEALVATQDGENVRVTQVERNTEPALQLHFAGKRQGILYIGSITQDQNLSAYLDKNMRLFVALRVDAYPSRKVEIHVESWYPVLGKVDITDFLHAQPLGEWRSLTIDLACFANSGANFKTVNDPFWIGTDGELVVSVADIAWRKPSDEPADFACSRESL